MKLCSITLLALSLCTGLMQAQAQTAGEATVVVKAASDADAARRAWDEAVRTADSTQIREALVRVAALPASQDDVVLPILIQAVGFAATHDNAILGLRARTHLQPGLHNFGTGYPNYPLSDAPADWDHWLTLRAQDLAKQREIEDHDRRIKALQQLQADSSGR